ncbi:hypothetical protein DFH09DRAFT_899057, partial [Mycena vulgaris]
MDTRETPDEALTALYGPVLAESPPIQIYVEGAAPGTIRTKSAGAGVCFGLGSPENISLKVPRPGLPTADRSRLYAIHEVVRIMNPDKKLVIFCTSKMVIKQLCYATANKVALGCPGPNGDIFKDTVSLIAKRHGQTILVYVESKADNELKRDTYSLAK